MSEMPLQERNCLDVNEFVARCRVQDVRKAHTRRVGVRSDLHGSPWFHEASESAEEQVHQVLVPPPCQRMAVQEALHHTCMWEVVIHRAELSLHIPEARVRCDPSAVDVVQNLRVVLLKLDHRVVDL